MPTDNLKNSYTEDEKLRAAYALNLFAVSVSQIIDYNDKNVLEQEYNAILNNLNLEQMPKDDTLLDTVKTIMDTITYFRMSEGDKEIIDLEYQNKMKNAIWTAVPSVSTIFAPRKHTAIGLALTLATQVGTGYMNYRRHKAEYQLEREKEYWQLKRGAIDQLNGLQKDLFDTAWRLADKYGYPDEYRLVGNQLHEYNAILMDDNPIRRYNRLEAIKEKFSAYTPFWYQIGSTANSIYRDETIDLDVATRNLYRDYALDHFSTYERLNKFNVLRYDVLTSSWALEYVDLLDLNDDIARQKAEKLVSIAERYAGTTHKDALELCAYAYLKLNDRNNAERLFSVLVNEGYNVAINAKILSGFYIQKMQIPETATEAERQYNVLKLIVKPDDMLPLPAAGTDLENWNPDWGKKELFQVNDYLPLKDARFLKVQNKENLTISNECAQIYFENKYIVDETRSYLESASYLLYNEEDSIVCMNKLTGETFPFIKDINSPQEMIDKKKIATLGDMTYYVIENDLFFFDLDSKENGLIAHIDELYDSEHQKYEIWNISVSKSLKLIYQNGSKYIMDLALGTVSTKEIYLGSESSNYFVKDEYVYFLDQYIDLDCPEKIGYQIKKYRIDTGSTTDVSVVFAKYRYDKDDIYEIYKEGMYNNYYYVIIEWTSINCSDRLGFNCFYFDISGDELAKEKNFYIWNSFIYQVEQYENFLIYVNASKQYSLVKHNFLTDKKKVLLKHYGETNKSSFSDRILLGKGVYQRANSYVRLGKWLWIMENNKSTGRLISL